ncbi:MAG: CerR family C-terminal domain-containing protein [Acidobacteriaceae bacterium]|nr:CerR family C-terminal domain-containing protein [Acidobacteriaceae bacterium]
MRLLQAAGKVFAEGGYEGAKVRDICALADVNVAAVNYHFGDKLGLYTAVLKNALMADTDASIQDQIKHCKSPEEALRFQVRSLLREAYGRDLASLHIRLMTQELARPSAALDRVVDEVIRPRYARLRETISRIVHLPPDSDKVRLCAHSIVGQVVHYVHATPVISRVWPELKLNSERIDQIADHITEFSLCSLHALAGDKANKKHNKKRSGRSTK